MKNPEEFLPLTQTTTYIMVSLAGGTKHGYAVIFDVEERSEGAVRLGIGNAYVTLKRLLDSGLIERAGELEEQGERKKLYRLTGLGEKVLDAESRRVARLNHNLAGLHPAFEGTL